MRRTLALWLLLFGVYAATVGLDAFAGSDYGGDEPHYLLAAHSIVHDGDVDVTDEYDERAYAAFYPHALAPQGEKTEGRLNEPHGIGFPLLIAPAYALGGAKAVELFLAALAALPVPDRPSDEDGYRRIRGASRLPPRGLAVLRALYLQREAWARAEHRPPFKVLSPETLVALAERQSADPGALAGVPGLSLRLVERYGEGLLAAVRRGLTERLPEPPRGPRPARPVVTAASRQRADALRKWRAEAAEGSGLDPGVLLPQRLIDALALDPPSDLDGLRAVPGLRRWRVEAFGRPILAALHAH